MQGVKAVRMNNTNIKQVQIIQIGVLMSFKGIFSLKETVGLHKERIFLIITENLTI